MNTAPVPVNRRKAVSRTKEAPGQKGVSQKQVGSGKEHDPDNFANDRERVAAAGRKGGQESHKRD
jgi:uncharacterized protein